MRPVFKFHDGVGSSTAPKCSKLTSSIEGTGTLIGDESRVGECSCDLEGHPSWTGPCPFKPWCFLENIRDPRDPTKHCFRDTEWSPTAGRFWSSEACKHRASKEEEPFPDYDISAVDLKDDMVVSMTPIPATSEPIHYDATGGAEKGQEEKKYG